LHKLRVSEEYNPISDYIKGLCTYFSRNKIDNHSNMLSQRSVHCLF